MKSHFPLLGFHCKLQKNAQWQNKLVYPASFSRSLQANKLVRVTYFPLKQEDTKSRFWPRAICLIRITFGLGRIEASLGQYIFGRNPITDLQKVGWKCNFNTLIFLSCTLKLFRLQFTCLPPAFYITKMNDRSKRKLGPSPTTSRRS